MVQVTMGDLNAAVLDYSQAIQVNSKDAGVYINRAIAYAALDKPDAAISDYTAAIALEPNNARAYHGRAMARLNRKGAEGEIQSDLKMAADLYQKQGEGKQAKAILELIK
jgi:tetratricopeptide (TPR) repeat protein